MQSRINNPAGLVPDAMQAMLALSSAVSKSGLSPAILGLVHMRVSQVNGCSVCVDMGWRQMRGESETDERLFAVAAWRDTPYFTAAERAALALAEAVTRIADRADPVPDAVWNEAARHFSERELAALTVSIAVTNVWNRLNVSTRQVAGEWLKSSAAREWMDKHAVAQ
ncbi:MAG TPA: carboxymuconolactone decarboxylase family protein [Bryobacteraceae bacterium]|nr:carboxymuconolactone decarboxylase family protein [Bryobacteraceae bacterium]